MALQFWIIGKTKASYLNTGIAEYKKRSSKYLKIEEHIIPDIKIAAKRSSNELKKLEGDLVLKKLKPNDFLILLDEKGKTFTSRKFADFITKRMNLSMQPTIFLIGGAFGFDEALYKRANLKISISDMTFSHQLIRLIFWEQLYRAISIINHLPYHND